MLKWQNEKPKKKTSILSVLNRRQIRNLYDTQTRVHRRCRYVQSKPYDFCFVFIFFRRDMRLWYIVTITTPK